MDRLSSMGLREGEVSSYRSRRERVEELGRERMLVVEREGVCYGVGEERNGCGLWVVGGIGER